jgi:hypothetical protein
VSGSQQHLRRATFALVATVVLIAGCDLVGRIGTPRGGLYPDACAQWGYSARRCEAIVDRGRDNAQVTLDEVRSIQLLPFEPQVGLGGYQVALIRFELLTGASIDQAVHCIGVDMSRACNENAEIVVVGDVDHDVPCAGEPPAGCATLPPTPDPAAVAAARSFSLDSLDVRLDDEGPYDIRLGTATLPNGYLSERSLDLADPRPDSFWIDAGVRLDIRSDVAGRPPIGSIYRDPFDGPEPVTIFLVFEVTDLDGPSVMQVRDIVVR